MCTIGHGEHPMAVVQPVVEGDWADEVIRLEPVDAVSITTVCDNLIDF
jgi:hypothetical protein